VAILPLWQFLGKTLIVPEKRGIENEHPIVYIRGTSFIVVDLFICAVVPYDSETFRQSNLTYGKGEV